MPPLHGDLIPAIGYIRVSTAREEMISPELQERAIREWADRHDRRITGIVTDLDKSGRNFKRRVQEAIQAIRDDEAREIIVWKFSRFGRNRVGWAVHLDKVESAGGALISATEEVDAKTAAGKFTRGMLAEVAAFESDRASEQWKETLSWRLAHGLPKHGHKRFGYIRRGRILVPGETNLYRTDPDDPAGERYEPDPDLVGVYRSLYERYVSGDGGPALVTWLNQLGVPTTSGGPWNIQALYRALDSGFAVGLLREHRDDCDCKHPTRCRNVTYYPGAQKPIIDAGLWDRYRALREERSRVAPRARTPRYPLSGLLRCGGCGHLMTTTSGRDGPAYGYKCGRWGEVPSCTKAFVRRAPAEKAVLAELAQWAEDIEREAAAAPTPEAVPVLDARPDVGQAEREIARLDRALVRLRKMRALDDDDDEQAEREYQAARAELLAERARHTERLEAARQQPERRTRADYGPVIAGLLDTWEVMTPGEKQAMLRSVVRVVRVHRRPGPRGTMPRMDIVPVWAPAGA